jgi:hypothetical protein
MFLSDLPCLILLKIIQDWISIYEVIQTDTSYCNKTTRKLFLNLVHFRMTSKSFERPIVRLKMSVIDKDIRKEIILIRSKQCDLSQLFDKFIRMHESLHNLACFSNEITISEFNSPLIWAKTNTTFSYVFWRSSYCIQKTTEHLCANSTCIYLGEILFLMRAPVFHGEGVLHQCNEVSLIYRGHFSHGTMSGEGVMSFLNGTSYVGCWSSNKLEGLCEIKFANGLSYLGCFKSGLLVN